MPDDAPAKPHTATAILTIRLHGKQMEWPVGALYGVDDARSLKRHLKRWMPTAEWVSMRWDREAQQAEEQTRARGTAPQDPDPGAVIDASGARNEGK